MGTYEEPRKSSTAVIIVLVLCGMVAFLAALVLVLVTGHNSLDLKPDDVLVLQETVGCVGVLGDALQVTHIL